MFDFRSERLFELSNNLSFPKKYTPENIIDNIVVNNATMDVNALNEAIMPYITSDNLQEKEVAFNYLVELINTLQANKATIDGLDPTIQELITVHFSTNLNNKQKTNALKNLIYYNMWKTGKSLSNWIAQTTPISMGAARTAADASPSGQFAKQISNNNPMARFVSQYQNSIGKDSIGVDAVGIKVWSLLLNYFHEGLSKCESQEEFIDKYTTFKRTYESGELVRVVFEAKTDSGEIINLTQSITNPNINWNKVGTAEFKHKIASDIKRFNNIPEDIFVTISVLLSAATDNAKELILEKINAGPDLAGVYIYLLTTGVKFDQIAAFMTTEAVVLAQAKSKRNLNLPQTQFNSVKSAIKYYLEGASIYKYFSSSYVNGINSKVRIYFKQNNLDFKKLNDFILKFDNLEDLKKNLEPLRQFLLNGDINEEEFKSAVSEDELDGDFGDDYIDNWDDSYYSVDDSYISEDDYYEASNPRVRNKQRRLQINLNRFFEEVYNRQAELDTMKNKETLVANLNTLKMLLESAEELNILGRLGSLNQGIKPKLIDKIKLENRIENFINNRISQYYSGEEVIELSEKWNLTPSNIFDFELFTSNEEYQNDMINLYNKVKDTFNILDIITSVPHFKAMITAYGVDNKISSTFVNSYRLSKTLTKQFVKGGLIKAIAPKHIARINEFVNEVIIHKFLNTITNSNIFTQLGDKVYYNGQLTDEIESRELDFSSPDNRATYKHIFENSIFRKLKERYPANNFIQDLTWNTLTDSYGNEFEFLQLPLNLDTVDQESNRESFSKYLQDFNSIKEDIVDGTTVKDLFFLYNLVVNSNRPGKNSLTKIFKDSLKSGEVEGTIIFQYSKFLGDLIEEPITLDDFEKDDIIVRLLETDQTYKGLSKTYESNLGKFIFTKDGIALNFNTLNNAVKLPMTTGNFSSVDKLLTLDIKNKLFELAQLNQLEIKLICDE